MSRERAGGRPSSRRRDGHGHPLAMMSASGKPGCGDIYPPMPTGFMRL
ncbi:MAG: hypothetical protein ACK4R2_09200 [Roseateles sp.]